MSRGKFKPDSIYDTPFPVAEAVDFDPLAFDDAVQGKGVLVVHFSSMRCPVGMIDKHDSIRRPHPDHEGCSNGFVYHKEGPLQVLFSGNSKGASQHELGILDSSQAQWTFPRYYIDECNCNRPIYAAPFDRFYLADERILVPSWELIEASPSANDRLSFPAIQILNVMDNLGREYKLGDYEILKNGILHWLTPNQPGIDPETKKGRVFSIRYLYRPYWYLERMLHEVRVSQINDPMTGERRTERLPQTASMQREYVYFNEQKDGEARDPTSSRQQRGPADGSFPER